MSVLANWESGSLVRLVPGKPGAVPRIGRNRPAVRPRRRGAAGPPGLVTASPARPAVTSCAPNYARRRALAALLTTLLVTVAVVGLGLLSQAVTDDGVPERIAVVEVRPGETLWELAERVAPHSPRHAVVQRIRQLNGMPGSTIHPGQPLLVPDGVGLAPADTPS